MKSQPPTPPAPSIQLAVGGIVARDDGTVLGMKRSPTARNEPGLWDFTAGGGLEFGETTQAAICRELREEAGIETEVVTSLGNIEYIRPELSQHWISLHYLCRITEGEPKIMEPEKCTDLRWFKLEEIEGFPVTTYGK